MGRRCAISSVNVAEVQLENIFLVMEHQTFCKDTAAWIVGGRKRLEHLIASGKIEVEKNSGAPNCKWKCNAAQVLRNCKNMRK